jgi:hypothetical protein
VFSLLFLIIYRAIRVAWWILKLIIFLAILWGAARSLTTTSLPFVGDIVNWAHNASPVFVGSPYFSWVTENWWVFAVCYIFLNSLFLRPTLNKLSETGDYLRIFIGTIMNYFHVETETASMKQMREEGMLSVMKQGLFEGIFARILGTTIPDERLSAKAVRYGEEVSLSDDLKEATERSSYRD